MNLPELIDRNHVLVLSGPGGVGKTTAAASPWFVQRPVRKKNRRLNHRTRPSGWPRAWGFKPWTTNRAGWIFRGYREAPKDGELWALMLDAKQTYDALVKRYAKSPEQYERILGEQFLSPLQQRHRRQPGIHCHRTLVPT